MSERESSVPHAPLGLSALLEGVSEQTRTAVAANDRLLTLSSQIRQWLHNTERLTLDGVVAVLTQRTSELEEAKAELATLHQAAEQERLCTAQNAMLKQQLLTMHQEAERWKRACAEARTAASEVPRSVSAATTLQQISAPSTDSAVVATVASNGATSEPALPRSVVQQIRREKGFDIEVREG